MDVEYCVCFYVSINVCEKKFEFVFIKISLE